MNRNEFLERIGWHERLRPFLYKKLPSSTGWGATLGTLCGLLFGMMAVTGMILAMYYNPSPDKAYQSVAYIMGSGQLLAMVRGLHHWGAGAMVLAVFLHLLSTFFHGAYKAPRELTWIAGACLLLTTLGLGFTGYLLPWDMKAYWATVVSSNIPREIPVLGDAVTRILLGGGSVSGLTLTRFYSIHTLVLPALLLFFAVAPHLSGAAARPLGRGRPRRLRGGPLPLPPRAHRAQRPGLHRRVLPHRGHLPGGRRARG